MIQAVVVISRSRLRWSGIAAAVLLGAVLAPRPAAAWGGKMHEIINRRAAELLPGPAGAAWRPFARQLGMHASDADNRKSFVPTERNRHFLDIDAWGEHPFDEVPREYDALVRRHGREAAEKFGVAPWAIDECYRMVVIALRKGDWGAAGAWAADLGHYVADTHQPLHCTVNYDGQSTGNNGVHFRYEVTMMERFFDESVITAPASLRPVDEGPVEFCFAWMADAYPGVAALLEADDDAKARDAEYGDAYFERMWVLTEELSARQMNRAVHDLGALWAAAWTEAGSPPPPADPPPFRLAPVAELDPPAEAAPGASRKAWIAAGLAILGAFALTGG